MSECDVILPEPKFAKRDPILDARCRKLQAQQNEREYQKMTSNIDGRVHGLHRHGNTDSFSHQSTESNIFTRLYKRIFNLFKSLDKKYIIVLLAPSKLK